MGLGLQNNDWEKLVDSLIKQGILKSPRVIQSMRTVQRVNFLPENMQSYSTTDTPLPIGHGQTISAPHMVAIMNEALQLETGHKVLEIGAGSGWHAATVAEIVAPSGTPRSTWGHVYTIEIVQELAEYARKTVMKAGYGDRVTIVSGDGSVGYPEQAPYDRIVVAAAATDVPEPLLQQLKPGGMMLIPIGDVTLFQTLMRITKSSDGKTKRENLGGVAFVPLTGRFGHSG